MCARAMIDRARMTILGIPALLMIMMLALACIPAQAQEARLESFLPALDPGRIVPGADRFGPVTTSPAIVAPAYRGSELVGYAFLNSQYVNTDGYSSKPIHIVVGLDPEGTITGIELVAHSEPIVLIGIPEKRVIDYMRPFIGYNPIRAAMTGGGMPKTDIVSGATVTVLVMGESVVRASIRVARALGLGGAAAPAAAGAAAAREVDPSAGTIAGWDELLESGAVGSMLLTISDVNTAFEQSGDPAAARRPEPGDPDELFIELWTALVSQPAIGRSLLGDAVYESLARSLEDGQQAILIAGDGLYSFKGSGYVRGGIFDRIELHQGTETIRFRDHQHRRIGDIMADGAPHLQEIGVFMIPAGTEFDPAQPWRLQLLVQRSIGALDKAFVSFGLDYRLPEAYLKPVAAPAAAAPASTTAPTAPAAGAPEPATQLDSLADLEQTPLWMRIWQSKIASIVMLGLMLAALTLIFFFQDLLVAREKLFDRIRMAYLVLILVWLGWVAGAQLSVVNVLTFTTALREGFRWEAFLIDPLIFMLWCSVAAGLLFWGRGPFCGWLCPFGALQELSNKAAKALKLPQIKIPWRVHERMWPIKYIIFLGLFGVSLGSLAFAEVLAEIEPFKTAIVLRFMRDWWFVAFALALIGAGLFVERFFCRYLCPLGAALALPGRLRMFDWLKRYRECGNPCMRCFNECPVEAIHPEGHINPNECISCLHCQVLYHHDHKCPVRIQRRVKREKREAVARPASQPPIGSGPASAQPITPAA